MDSGTESDSPSRNWAVPSRHHGSTSERLQQKSPPSSRKDEAGCSAQDRWQASDGTVSAELVAEGINSSSGALAECSPVYIVSNQFTSCAHSLASKFSLESTERIFQQPAFRHQIPGFLYTYRSQGLIVTSIWTGLRTRLVRKGWSASRTLQVGIQKALSSCLEGFLTTAILKITTEFSWLRIINGKSLLVSIKKGSQINSGTNFNNFSPIQG